MSDENKNISISGSTIQGGINNFGGTQTFHGSVTITLGNLISTINGMQAADDDKAQLQKLISELEAALKQVSAEQQPDAEKIAKRAKEAVEEVAAETPETEAVEVKVSLLKKAATNIASVMPIVTSIALNLLTQMSQYKH